MLVKYHVAYSSAVAGSLYLVSGSWQMAAASMVTGVLIDIDHSVEYLVEHGFSLDIRRFFRLVFEAQYRRVFYVLHAWEWLFLAVPAVWAARGSAVAVGLLIGYLLHLSLDQLSNRGTPFTYFLIWRWRQGFDHALCFPGLAHRLKHLGPVRK
jgi:hypothetical protein